MIFDFFFCVDDLVILEGVGYALYPHWNGIDRLLVLPANMSSRMIEALKGVLRATFTISAAVDRTMIYQVASLEAMCL
jgi:hypothetical protein